MSSSVEAVPAPVGLGFDAAWQKDFDRAARRAFGSRRRPGRLISTHRVGFDVVTADGREFAIHKEKRRNPLTAPATGDWVVLADVTDTEHPVITAVLPRRNAMVRRDPADRAAPQVLSANADVVAVVQGADRPVNARRLERQLALAHGSGAGVVIILTKADLGEVDDVVRKIKRAAPTDVVLVTAAHDGTGMSAVEDLTEGGSTLVLVGESGAGKSSLVNAVLGRAEQAIGVVRDGDSKGRHTTTRRELIALPNGGALLDTPGVRAIGLWPGHTDLDTVFAEITEAADRCRFADCTHVTEPGCGVRADVQQGVIDIDRLDAWTHLVAELKQTRTELEQKGWR